MAVYNNRYYPDELQVTWQDLANASTTWGNSTSSWHTFTNVSTEWQYVGSNIDLGSVRSGYPISSAIFDAGTTLDPRTCLISYQVSDDGVTFSNVSAGVLSGRYVRTVANVTGRYLERLQTEIRFDTQDEVFLNVNTASLSGTVDGRFLPVALVGNVSTIQAAPSVGTYTVSAYDVNVLNFTTGDAGLYVVADYVDTDYVADEPTGAGFTFVLKDLDTWGKANVDVNGMDFSIAGFPRVEANAAQGTVTVV